MENKLGLFLKEKQGSLSLREFAKILDISHTYLDNLEKGFDNRTKKPVRITVATLSKIAKALDEPIEKLVAYSKNENYNNEDTNDNFDRSKLNIACFKPSNLSEEQEKRILEKIEDYARFVINEEMKENK